MYPIDIYIYIYIYIYVPCSTKDHSKDKPDPNFPCQALSQLPAGVDGDLFNSAPSDHMLNSSIRHQTYLAGSPSSSKGHCKDKPDFRMKGARRSKGPSANKAKRPGTQGKHAAIQAIQRIREANLQPLCPHARAASLSADLSLHSSDASRDFFTETWPT